MSADFDQLAAAARSGTMEANNALWSAVFALDRWWALPDGDPPRPRVGTIDGKPFLLAFTSGERARQQAQAWGLAAPDGSVNVIALSPQSVLGTLDSMRAAGIFGVVFDQGISGFFAPLDNLLPIYEHVRHLIVDEEPVGGWYSVYQGQEYRTDLVGNGEWAQLQGIPEPVPTQQLTELYAINLVANVGSARCAILSKLGDRLRLVTGQPDPTTAPAWQLTDRGIYESVVPSAEVETEGLRTDLPLTPAAPPLIMQKVLTPTQMRAAFDGRLRHIAGYVTRMDDVLHLRTPVEVIHQLQLLYPGSPFAGDAESVAVLRFPLRDGTWRLENTEPAPVPQYFIGPNHVMPMPAGAELQIFGRDGNQHVAMRYAGLAPGWIPA
jgi:hypothetical protein